jgi:hypothetical protein
MAARKQMSFQVIPTRVHGMIDYATGVLLLAAPYLFGFADGSAAQWVPMILGIATVGASLMTRYELGVYGLIPMPIHLMLDAGTAVFLIASPWLFGFADRIYWPHVMVGVFELVIGALSRTQPQRGPAYA